MIEINLLPAEFRKKEVRKIRMPGLQVTKYFFSTLILLVAVQTAMGILDAGESPAACHTEHVTLTAKDLDRYYPVNRTRRTLESPRRDYPVFEHRIPAAG